MIELLIRWSKIRNTSTPKCFTVIRAISFPRGKTTIRSAKKSQKRLKGKENRY
jgi:hypothetical protein